MVTFGLAFASLALAFPAMTVVAGLTENTLALTVTASAFLMLVAFVSSFERTMEDFASRHASAAYDSYNRKPNFLIAIIGNYGCCTACVLISGLAIIQASLTRQLKWRGITYQVNRSQVRLKEYKPYTPKAEPESQLGQMSI